MHNAEGDVCTCPMCDAPTIQKGERFDTPRLVEMGVLPPEFLRDEVSQWPSASVVANINHETRTITFDTLPSGGGMWSEGRGPAPEAHKSIHDYQEQLKAKRKRRKGRR